MAKLISKQNRMILVFWIVSWVLISNLFLIYRFVGLNWSEDIFVLSPREWFVLCGQATFIGLIGGFLFGLVDIYISRNNYLHRTSFGMIVLLKSTGYFLIAMIALFFGFFLAAILNGLSAQDAMGRTFRFYSSSYLIVIMVYLLVNMTLLNFIRQVSEKFGVSDLVHIFFGKYSHPVEEDRIIMFLDLKSSSGYAERLGHIKYSQLIQDCFIDITQVIEDYDAQIYQYAGDEIILSWKSNNSKGFQNAASLFFAFKGKIELRADHYQKKYGCIPEFKAGINAGRITVAEVGVKKKEIAFHGDVINTTSRIQEQCNVHNQMLLCSEYFVQELRKWNQFKTAFVKEFLPRGKRNPVRIYSVEPQYDQGILT